MVACTCHPKLCGRLRSGGSWFQATPSKKVFETITQQKKKKKKLGVVECTCHSSYRRKLKEEDYSPGWPRQKTIPYLQNV
jgi:hypothetical protein